ncbi:hypothetical protein PHLCEN_2v1918 [Hermanssonia centrifuga]|uniref:Uncharacterized protein n=1 Tax=Hermanssonia centrifuga TaxID=98765 RepID=A0A2R6RVG2_9APHY|nr:hypothetical protein PHLCEN_2v1918 [Hermanssonia centrifuga]
MSSSGKSTDVKSARPTSRSRLEPTSDIDELHARLQADPRFNPPTPSPWKRIALLLVVAILLWAGVTMRKPHAKASQIVHAKRYV